MQRHDSVYLRPSGRVVMTTCRATSGMRHASAPFPLELNLRGCNRPVWASCSSCAPYLRTPFWAFATRGHRPEVWWRGSVQRCRLDSRPPRRASSTTAIPRSASSPPAAPVVPVLLFLLNSKQRQAARRNFGYLTPQAWEYIFRASARLGGGFVGEVLVCFRISDAKPTPHATPVWLGGSRCGFSRQNPPPKSTFFWYTFLFLFFKRVQQPKLQNGHIGVS